MCALVTGGQTCALPIFLVRHAHDQRVTNGGMGLENLLDFLGVNFLASSVDADAATAQQGQAAIGLDHAPVAGNRIADPIDCAASLGGFYGILVISRRDRPPECDKSRYAAYRRHFPAFLVKSFAEFAHSNI